jgi:hypothetical protein
MRASFVTISGMLLALSLTVQSAAQSSTGSAGASGQGSSGSAPSQSSPSQSTTPASGGDTSSSSTSSDSSSSGSGFSSPRIQPGDYLAPLSIMRWGPFSLNTIDTQASWSNQPLGLNGDVNAPAQLSGIPLAGSTIGSHTSASMVARWRWGTGFIGVQYTPSMDYQTATGQRQINHNVSAFIDHPFRFGKWRLTLGLHSATSNIYSQFYQPPAIEPLLDLEVPITTVDLIGLLNDPLPLQPVTPQLILVSSRVFSANASAALSRQFSGRNTLSIAAAYVLNQTLDFGNGSGALFNYPRASGITLSATWSHLISARASWAFLLNEGQSLSGVYGATTQQSAQFTYSWRPWRKVAFSLGAGPTRVKYVGYESFQAAGSASASYAVPGGAVIMASYSKGFELTGFAGPQNNKSLNLTWAQSPLKGRLGKWRYQVTTGVQLGTTTATYNGQGVAVGSGFSITGSLSYPVTQRLAFISNYGYLFQNVTNTVNNGPLEHFQRSLASAGLRYSFGYPGQQRY